MSNLDICRTCGEITRSAYSHNLYDDPSMILMHQIEVLTGMWLPYRENLPDHICAYCYQDLKKAVDFRERCIKMQMQLQCSENDRDGEGDDFTTEITKKNQLKQMYVKDEKMQSQLESREAINLYLEHSPKLKTVHQRTDTEEDGLKPSMYSKQRYSSEQDPLVVKKSTVSTYSDDDDDDETQADADVYAELLATAYSDAEIEENCDVEDDKKNYAVAPSPQNSDNEEFTYTDWAESPEHSLGSVDDEYINKKQSNEQDYDEDWSWDELDEHQQDQSISTTVDKDNTETNYNAASEEIIIKDHTQITRGLRKKVEMKTTPEVEQDSQEITSSSVPEVKPKRKYTFKTRKPRSEEKKKYKPTRSIYICELCGNTYRSLFTFSEHKLKHAGEKKFKCTECPKSFLTNRCLKQHIIKHTDARPFVCRTCSLTFRSRAHRNDHEKRHENPDPLYCSYCDKKFVTITGLQLHEASHRGVRKFHCNQCDRSFMTRKHLKTHYNTKLHQQNVKNYKIEILDPDIEMD